MRSDIGWDTLQERRARARLLMLHKISHSLVAIPLALFPISPSNYCTRGAPSKFYIPHTSTLAYKNTFMLSAPSLWNALPAQIASIADPDAFRSSLAAVSLTA